MTRRLTTAACAAALLLCATDARAGTLALDGGGGCFDPATQLVLSGSGFTPDLAVELAVLAGGADSGGGSALTDGTGAFSGHGIGLPEYDAFTPRTVTIAARDQVDPARSTSVDVQQVRFGSNLPVAGRSSSRVTWQFAGFPAGKAIYGHYRTGNRTVKTVRFGVASGPCGTLSVKAKRIPVKARPGSAWYLQVDTSPRFSAGTRPEYDVTFTAR